MPGHQPRPELGQHAEVEAGVGQLEPERILPVDPGAHRVGRLPVAEVLEELEDRDQGQPPRGERRLALAGIEPAEILVLVDDAELVAQPRHQGALRESGTGDPRGLGRDLADRLRMKAHDHLHSRNGYSGIRRQYQHLIQMPFVARPWPAALERVGEGPPEPQAPGADALVAHDDAALGQDRLDVAQAQAEAVVEPHRVADDLGREAEAAVRVRRRRHARQPATSTWPRPT